MDSIEGDSFTEVGVPPGPVAAGALVPIELRYRLPAGTACDNWRGLLFYGPAGGEVLEVPVSVVTQSLRQGGGRLAP